MSPYRRVNASFRAQPTSLSLRRTRASPRFTWPASVASRTACGATPNGWIAGAVPDVTQDVYVRFSAVTLDADAQAKSLSVGALSDLHVQNHRLTVPGTLSFDTSNLSVDAGGTVEADKISVNTLVAGAGSLVRFNNLTRGPTSSATSITFGGSVAIGYNAGSVLSETFAPADYTTWTVGENLTIGDQKGATLAVNATRRGTSAETSSLAAPDRERSPSRAARSATAL